MGLGKSSQDWEVSTEGTYGEFNTSAGRVSYLMTKAKLGGDTTKESKLTLHLAPVREVLPIEEMNFNQLLQRDLDDYRVATELVDYLLKPKFTGPAFYTPVLAAVLPFDGINPVDRYPEITGDKTYRDSDDLLWEQTQFGDAFRVLKLQDENQNNLHKIKLGRLEFNKHKIKLAVIDGQHRVMALLAIRRTIDRNWETTKGNPYRFFYETRIKELIKENKYFDLKEIEFPVCICWFPDTNPSETSWPDPHKAARKLFVDVNQNAKKPNQSRLILLSDTELVSIFTRALLNCLREEDSSPFPLHAIEYDYPHETGGGSPVRPTALANVIMLRKAIDWALRGDKKYIENVDRKISRGRTAEEDKDKRLRKELEVDDWLTQETLDEGMTGNITFDRRDLGNENFPKSKVENLNQKFMEGWGEVIIKIVSEFIPFKCHVEALTELKKNWTGTVNHGALAYDAMFKGLGTYWTLKADHEQWLENNRSKDGANSQERTDTVKAWEAIQEKEKEFKEERAKKIFDRKRLDTEQESDRELVNISDSIYTRLITQAFLSGAILTLASLKYNLEYDSAIFSERFPCWIKSWNEFLNSSPKREKVKIFGQNSLSFLSGSRLKPSFSVYFRYLLLEMMYFTARKKKDFFKKEETKVIYNLLSSSRKLYLDFLELDQLNSLKKTEASLSSKERKNKAEENSQNTLQDFCKKWFKISEQDFKEWISNLDNNSNDSENLSENEDLDDSEIEEDDDEAE
ncbi:MAG: DNA sulfur modification protein DndB [Microcoleaceae cyanobacterium]